MQPQLHVSATNVYPLQTLRAELVQPDWHCYHFTPNSWNGILRTLISWTGFQCSQVQTLSYLLSFSLSPQYLLVQIPKSKCRTHWSLRVTVDYPLVNTFSPKNHIHLYHFSTLISIHSVILSPLHSVSLTHKNPQRCKIIFMAYVFMRQRTIDLKIFS